MEFIPNQLVSFAFLQSVFLLAIYLLSGKIRRAVSPYLVILVAVMSIGLLGRIWIFTFDGVARLYSLSEYATLLFGSTVYLFTKSSLSGSNRVEGKDLIHFIPGALYIVVISIYYVFAPGALINARFESGELFKAVLIFMGLGLLVNTTYWLQACRLFWSYKKRLVNEASFSVKHGFLQNFLIGVGICLFSWLVVYLIGAIGDSWLERSIRPIIWMALCFLILFISYYSIRQPELLPRFRDSLL